LAAPRRNERVEAMGQVGSAGDNAATKRFFRLLQNNALERRHWSTQADLRLVT
jgi:putative transposase